jgi:hypothetical protein
MTLIRSNTSGGDPGRSGISAEKLPSLLKSEPQTLRADGYRLGSGGFGIELEHDLALEEPRRGELSAVYMELRDLVFSHFWVEDHNFDVIQPDHL